MLEFEKKVLLTGEEYRVLVMTMCKHAQSTIQTNYYFDTDDYTMNKKSITCRIRAKDGKFQATVKSHGGENVDCSVESTAEVKNEFDADAFKGMGLHFQGCLVTERIVAFKNEFCEMVLDRNTYLDFVDFELEIEYLDNHEEYVMRLLNNIAETLLGNGVIITAVDFLARVGKGKSKSGRFFERKAIK